ncbi:MAG TPA: sugar ABC transporter permease [Caldilineaceae bacterium]|nr:sugar ABC transporter permease [Caldilineaceae bacterium]
MAVAADTQVVYQRKEPSLLARLVGARSALQAREAYAGYLFLLPWLLGLIIFWIGPILSSAYFSLLEYDVLSPAKYVGPQNYIRAFTGDKQFWPSLQRTLVYAVTVVPIGLAGSLMLAILLNQRAKGTNIFRTLYFLPHLTPTVALALLWTWLFHPSVGPINVALSWVGIEGPGWLTSKQWALPSVIIIALWAGMGGNAMLIFLAGLQGVPKELLEAAEIDGAGSWAKFWSVTLPMISPTVLFNLILGIIAALKVFTISFVATNGGPSYATWFYALHIYNQAFHYFRMGYAAALAWIFVIILLAFTYIQLQVSRRWVYYAGESS